MEKGMALGLSESELRRVFEDELSRLQRKQPQDGGALERNID